MTAVCATPHVGLARTLGADPVIDYTVGDFTGDSPDYDVVFDAAGKSSFGRCKQYPLDQIVDACRYAETGQKIGNVVITVAPSR